jgi:hypothetical protein
MDEIVKLAMLKWPDVPHCFAWLGLDARGRWFMRDEAVQRAGPFSERKGDPLQHTKLIDFISRNYLADAHGQWYFQNGPQRVYVELELCPWVWRVEQQANGFELKSHTGLTATMESSFQDETGRLYFKTQLGLGVVHSMDMWPALQWLEQGGIHPKNVEQKELSTLFNFVKSPAQRNQRA